MADSLYLPFVQPRGSDCVGGGSTSRREGGGALPRHGALAHRRKGQASGEHITSNTHISHSVSRHIYFRHKPPVYDRAFVQRSMHVHAKLANLLFGHPHCISRHQANKLEVTPQLSGAQMGQAEMHATAKSTNLERLEDHMTTQALQHTTNNHAASFASNSPKQDSTQMCVVYMGHETSVVLMSCKHQCMCKGCTDKLIAQSGRQTAMCPVCRSVIMDTIEPFMC